MDIAALIKENLPDGVEMTDKSISLIAKEIKRVQGDEFLPKEDYRKKVDEIARLEGEIRDISGQASDGKTFKDKYDEIQKKYTELQEELVTTKTTMQKTYDDYVAGVAAEKDTAALNSALERHLKAAGANPDPLILEGLMNKFDRSALKCDGNTITNWEDVSKSVIEANAQHFGKEKIIAADVADPPAGNPASYTMEDVKKMSTQEINKNWDKVKPVLEKGK